MQKEEIFNTYNDLKKHYIIMAVTVQDLLKDPRYKDSKCLLLLTRPDVIPPKKRKKRKTKTTRQMLLEFIDKQNQFNQFIFEQFKAHGWIK